jgi:DedD protein
MGLFSFLRPKDDSTPGSGRARRNGSSAAADDVQHLRLRAKRRLIGAALLVLVGVVVFPLVFETQPRPIPVDLPITIPKKDAVAPLAIPASAPSPVATASAPETVALQTADAGSAATATPPIDDAPAGREKAIAARESERPVDKTTPKPVSKPADAEALRIQALLDGKEAPRKAESGAAQRFIVQVGAFGDTKAAQEMRLKVEKLGLKTYAQAVETPDGKRTRVRVGTFATREEAAKAAAKLHAAGLAGTVLTL